MTPLVVITAIAAGAIGALARYTTTQVLAARAPGLPWAVLAVNVVGSAIGGAALALAESGAWGAEARLIVLSGFCGGLTTFSTFSVETVQLVLDGRMRVAVASVAANLVLGVGAAASAWALLRLALGA